MSTTSAPGVWITRLDWLIVAAPFAVVMTLAPYFFMLWLMPLEMAEVAGGRQAMEKSVTDLGPMSRQEKKLTILLLVLLSFLVTEGKLHHFDTSATMIAVRHSPDRHRCQPRRRAAQNGRAGASSARSPIMDCVSFFGKKRHMESRRSFVAYAAVSRIILVA